MDFSKEMVRLCREKGLKARLIDFEKMQFKPNSFDGIWAYTSLMHIPKKNFRRMLVKIEKGLKKDGLFFIGMKEGHGESLKDNTKYESCMKRYEALYTKKELGKILATNFEIVRFSCVRKRNRAYLNYLCRKV